MSKQLGESNRWKSQSKESTVVAHGIVSQEYAPRMHDMFGLSLTSYTNPG